MRLLSLLLDYARSEATMESSSNAAAGPGHLGVRGAEDSEGGHGSGLGGDDPVLGGSEDALGEQGSRGEAGDKTGGPPDSQLESGDGTKGNENFSEITKEGKRAFSCNICLEEFDQPRKVKTHISKKHLKSTNEPTKKRKGDEEMDTNEIKKHKSQAVFSESILEEFERTGMFTSTQVGADDIAPEAGAVLVDESVLDQTIVRAPPESIDDAMKIILELDEKVKKMEEELKVAWKGIAEKGNIISVKEDELQVFKGTLNSVEDEYKKSLARIARLEKALANMKTEIDFLRGSKAGGEKVKKLEKDVKEAESRAGANVKKVEELVVAKATLEVELVRMKKVCDLQMESLDRSNKKDGVQEVKQRQEEVKKLDVKCKQYESPAGCTFGVACKFIHPTVSCEYFTKVGKCPINDCKDLHKRTVIKENNGDCYFWINGSCRFSEADCNKGRHIKDKFGVNRRQESFLGQGPGLIERAPARGQQVVGMSQPPVGGAQPIMVGPQPIMLGPQHLMPALVGQQQGMPTVMGGMGGRLSMGVQHQVMDNQYLQAMNNQQHRVDGGQQNSLGGISYLGGFHPALVSGHLIPGSRDAGQSGMETGNSGAQEDSLNNISNSSSMSRAWPGPQRMGGR